MWQTVLLSRSVLGLEVHPYDGWHTPIFVAGQPLGLDDGLDDRLVPGLDAAGARAAGFTLAGTREATDAIVEQLLSLK